MLQLMEGLARSDPLIVVVALVLLSLCTRAVGGRVLDFLYGPETPPPGSDDAAHPTGG